MGQMLTIDLLFLVENMYISNIAKIESVVQSHLHDFFIKFYDSFITSGNGKFNQKITI